MILMSEMEERKAIFFLAFFFFWFLERERKRERGLTLMILMDFRDEEV